jgi:hypothetical protein
MPWTECPPEDLDRGHVRGPRRGNSSHASVELAEIVQADPDVGMPWSEDSLLQPERRPVISLGLVMLLERLERRPDVVIDDREVVSESGEAAPGAEDLARRQRCAQCRPIPFLPVEDRGECGQVRRESGVAGFDMFSADRQPSPGKTFCPSVPAT